jgi:hypothetical protein
MITGMPGLGRTTLPLLLLATAAHAAAAAGGFRRYASFGGKPINVSFREKQIRR